MKKAIISSILVVLMLSGCGHSLTEGEVYDKNYIPAHSDVVVLPMVISNGETTHTQMIPIVRYYPDIWKIDIRSFDTEKGKWQTEDYYVSEDVYNTVNIGDYFVYDKNLHLTEQPYTDRRQ